MTLAEREKARILADKWMKNPDAFGEAGSEFIADSLAKRLLAALDELERRDNIPHPRPPFHATKG